MRRRNIGGFFARAAHTMVLAGVLTAGTSTADLTGDIREAAARVEGHPRLFMTPSGAARLPERAKADAISAKIAASVIAKAEEMTGQPPATRELRGRRMLHVSRQTLDRIATLSLAWHLTGERRFVDRTAAEIQAVAAFADWNPGHFLDTAEMTLAVAIGYDWLHAELDEATRTSARRAIAEKGLAPALASDRHWWMHTTNNWNQVCHGGLVAGALAVLDDERDAAMRMIERAVRHVPNAMQTYAPRGAYPEGPGYWGYGTSYNVILLALLDSAMGTTFGLGDMDGFDRTGAFPILMTGPSGLMFNFSDGRANRRAQPAVYWLARQYDHPAWARHEDRMMAESTRVSWLAGLSLLWREPAAADVTHDLPLHWTSGNEVPVSVHRESWDREDAVFVGLKAGPPTASHGHMDAGSFVLDANGVRWAHDLGMESYHNIEAQGIALWHTHQDAGRWTVFRNNNLSHNTLVIDGDLQHAAGDAPMARFSADPRFPHSVVDLTPVYQGQVVRAQRGVALLPGGQVLVRDHLTGLRPGAEVRWGMVTRAEAGEAEGASLVLREAAEALMLTIHGVDGAAWQTTSVAVPPNEWDSPNEGFSMVSFTATAPESGTLDLTVVLRPENRNVVELEEKHLARPMEWSPAGR